MIFYRCNVTGVREVRTAEEPSRRPVLERDDAAIALISASLRPERTSDTALRITGGRSLPAGD